MTIQYKFTSLASLADYFGNKALEARANAERFRPTQVKRAVYVERAATFESVADMIRSTVLEP